MFSEHTEQMNRLRGCLHDIAKELGGILVEQVIFAWIRKLPSKPVPIIGSGNISRVNIALAALDVELNQEQWYRIWVASKGAGVP